MAEKKSHLIYTGRPEGTTEFRYSSRSYDPERQESVPNVNRYITALADIDVQMERRQRERNPILNVPATISCLEFEFFNWFNSHDFEVRYRADFGLSPIKYYDLNKKALFAIVDQELFTQFQEELRKCIACQDHNDPDYNTLVRFIKGITYHSSEKILESLKNIEDTVYLSLIDNVELSGVSTEIRNSLRTYLQERDVSFTINEDSHEIEIRDIDTPTLEEISRNFDVVHAVNSSKLIVTRPSRFGTNIRAYPFAIKDPEDNCPTIGIIDTGVSTETPLRTIVINDDYSYGVNGMNPMVDEAYEGDGHGTAVAAFTALGNQLAGDIQTELIPDCKILSIKVLGENSGKVSNSDVINLIRKANAEHGIKLFVLTVCFQDCLKNGEPPSDYAYLLDKLAYELDILMFICTANFLNYNNDIIDEYPRHYLKDETNFCSPADSINNLTIGAVGDNLEPEMPITPSKYPLSSSSHPAVYTRKYHLKYEELTIKNSKLCKPDVTFSGGNIVCMRDRYGTFIEDCSDSALQYLSANELEPILRGVGTSFSTSLVANIGAKLLKAYPNLRPQSIKALIINSAEKITLNDPFHEFPSHHKTFLVGHGKPQIIKCLYSDVNEATILIEDSIIPEQVKSFPIRLPNYLNNLAKNKSLIGIEATLCYKVLPVQNNQIAYCPVNIAFGVFKNVPLENNNRENGRMKRRGISGGAKSDIAFNLAWSQDAYYKSKMLSNTQKVSFYIKRDNIIAEDNTFKIAVNCHFHKLLPDYITQSLPQEYQYSLVIRVWENRSADDLEGKLYDEMQAINDLELLPNNLQAEQDAELDSDLEAEL